MALIANDANDLIEQMILLTRRLTELARRQCETFKANDFKTSQIINDEAGRLVSTYMMECQKIARHPEITKEASDYLKSQLNDETEKFREVLNDHAQIVERGLFIADGLVRAIAEETIAQRPNPIAYHPNMVAAPRRDTSAVTLDRRA